MPPTRRLPWFTFHIRDPLQYSTANTHDIVLFHGAFVTLARTIALITIWVFCSLSLLVIKFLTLPVPFSSSEVVVVFFFPFFHYLSNPAPLVFPQKLTTSPLHMTSGKGKEKKKREGRKNYVFSIIFTGCFCIIFLTILINNNGRIWVGERR